MFTQIDPMEKLDSEVEDILMDIADEFVESVSNWTQISSTYIFLDFYVNFDLWIPQRCLFEIDLIISSILKKIWKFS